MTEFTWMRRLRSAAAGLLIGLSLPAAAAEKITFRLDWKIYGAHAPFFLARERGYFSEAGLDVDIPEGQGAALVAKLVASGSEAFGFLDFGTMVKGVEQGLPLKAVFGVFQRSPMVILSRADAPLREPKDLSGKLLAMAPDESTAQIFPAVLAASRIDPATVSIVNPAVGAKSALFLQKRVDGMTGFVNVQIAQLEAQGAKVESFPYADHGVNTLSLGVVTNETFLRRSPDKVRAFLAGVGRGWDDARRDPEAAIEAVLKVFPEYKGQRAVLRRQLDLTFPLLATPNTAGKPVGWMASQDWVDTQRILVDYAGVKTTRSPADYFTNDHVGQ